MLKSTCVLLKSPFLVGQIALFRCLTPPPGAVKGGPSRRPRRSGGSAARLGGLGRGAGDAAARAATAGRRATAAGDALLLCWKDIGLGEVDGSCKIDELVIVGS